MGTVWLANYVTEKSLLTFDHQNRAKIRKKIFICNCRAKMAACFKLSSLAKRGSYRGILVMRDWLILFSVKREFRKLFFVTRDLKVLSDP